MLQIHSQCIQNVIICIQNCFMYKSLSVFSISGRIAGCKFLVPKDTRSVVQKLFFTATDFRNLALRRRCLVRSRDRFLLFPHVCHVHLNFATFVHSIWATSLMLAPDSISSPNVEVTALFHPPSQESVVPDFGHLVHHPVTVEEVADELGLLNC